MDCQPPYGAHSAASRGCVTWMVARLSAIASPSTIARTPATHGSVMPSPRATARERCSASGTCGRVFRRVPARRARLVERHDADVTGGRPAEGGDDGEEEPGARRAVPHPLDEDSDEESDRVGGLDGDEGHEAAHRPAAQRRRECEPAEEESGPYRREQVHAEGEDGAKVLQLQRHEAVLEHGGEQHQQAERGHLAEEERRRQPRREHSIDVVRARDGEDGVRNRQQAVRKGVVARGRVASEQLDGEVSDDGEDERLEHDERHRHHHVLQRAEGSQRAARAQAGAEEHKRSERLPRHAHNGVDVPGQLCAAAVRAASDAADDVEGEASDGGDDGRRA
eukprot:7131605-Prymnesium_polylepis.1